MDLNKVLVCSLAIGNEYKEALKYAQRSKELYCNKHNYIYVEGDETYYDKNYNITWSKVPLILDCLEKYNCEYVVWFDADIMIMDDTVCLEKIIETNMGHNTFMLCRDIGTLINTGAWFVKNNCYASKILRYLYEHEQSEYYRLENHAEQGSFTYLYDNNIFNLQKRSVILSNHYQTLFNCSFCFYKNGVFNVHLLGVRNALSIKGIFDFLCPFKMDEEDEETFKERRTKSLAYYEKSNFERDFILPERRKRICICSFNIGERYKEATKYSQLSKKKYCEKYGYRYEDDESVYDSTRHPAWSKIKLIQKCLEYDCDYVIWIDADAMIMNDTIPIETYIDKYMNDKDFLVSRDNGYRINTGVWFIKNTQYSKDIMKEVWNNTTKGEMEYWEQGSFCYFHDNNIFNLKNHTIDLHTDLQKEFNCAYCFYVYGLFIVHFLVMRDLNSLQARIEEMYIYKRDDENEYEYEIRMAILKDQYSICYFQRYC